MRSGRLWTKRRGFKRSSKVGGGFGVGAAGQVSRPPCAVTADGRRPRDLFRQFCARPLPPGRLLLLDGPEPDLHTGPKRTHSSRGGAKKAEGSVGSKAWVLCACESRQPTDGAAKCHMRSKYGWRRAKKRAQCHFDRQRSRDVPSVFSFHSPPIPMQTPCGRLASFFWYQKIARLTHFSMSNGRVGGETCAQSQAEGLDSTFGLFNEDF